MKYDYIECGDCLNLLRSLPDKSVDLVVTDPPYDVYAGKGGGAFGNRTSFSDIKFISNGFSAKVLDKLCRVMKKINIYLWCSQKQLFPLIEYFVKGKKCNFNIITWHKTNPVPACGNKYLTDTEYCLFFREKGVKIYGEYSTKFTYYVTPLNQKDKKLYNHPTIKPLDIIQNLVVNSSMEGDLVLDPFLGSGTTSVACVNTNRHYIGFELDPQYYNIACKRLDEVKGVTNGNRQVRII